MKKNSFILVFIFYFALSSLLIAGNGGSGYSRYGIGDLRYTLSDRGIGMGNAGIAAFSNSSIDRINPASWSGISRTRFSIGARFDGYTTTDGTSSAFLSSTSFDGVMLAFPMFTPSGIVFGVGLTPYSSINYNIASSSSSNGLSYNTVYKGEGGLSEGQLGLSYIPMSDISVGVKFSYYFGTLRHIINQSFSSADYSNADEIRSNQTHGAGFTLGVIYSGLSNTLQLDSTRQLTIGMVASTSSNLASTEEHYLTYTATNQSVTTRDTLFVKENSLKLPLRLGFGVAYRTQEFLVASDLVYQQWSSFSGGGTLVGNMRDSYRYSIGGELFPRREGTSSFFERWAYRAGFFYDASYFQVNNEAINEVGFTAGFGIPIISDTRLNLGAEYSFRGTTAAGLQKDNILRITFSLSGSERWFIPIEED